MTKKRNSHNVHNILKTRCQILNRDDLIGYFVIAPVPVFDVMLGNRGFRVAGGPCRNLHRICMLKELNACWVSFCCIPLRGSAFFSSYPGISTCVLDEIHSRVARLRSRRQERQKGLCSFCKLDIEWLTCLYLGKRDSPRCAVKNDPCKKTCRTVRTSLGDNLRGYNQDTRIAHCQPHRRVRSLCDTSQ